jgi:geranylgeranyl pyrophosphate synthase
MTVTDYKEAINARITEWFAAEITAAPTAESRLLLERMCTLIQRGGKRARPELLYMTYMAYGGSNPESLVDLGLALELHHQFLLVHDDIIDKDTNRYDGPNIIGYYATETSQEIAEAMAILAGDLLFTFSHLAVTRSRDYSAEQKVVLLEMLNSANIAVAYGQQLDAGSLAMVVPAFSEEKLLLTHSLKSSSYSAQLPMNCAAALLGLDAEEQAKIAAFAEPFGVLFQLVDDYSDYFSNNSAFNNRPKYRDFKQGKVTYPLHVALQRADTNQTERINRELGNKDISDKAMHEVVAMLEDCGAKKASQEQIERFFTHTMRYLENLDILPEQKRQFTLMLDRYRV